MTSVGASETRPVSSSVPLVNAGAFAPGTLLAGRYRIVALAGRGGMGEVYRAEDLRLGQTVALKFLPAALEDDPAARERLVAEVRSARTIAHPNVCRVYDIGDVDGRSFLTMEYIDGEDLASLLRRIGRLPAAKALEIARQLCAGLAAAHEKGVLHRDLKPANVMIDGRGQARITDFGLAVQAGPSSSPADFAGTVAYMAPERFHGAPATVQSDLYALGLILYEACTGQPAVKGTTVGGWEDAHAASTPTRPSVLAPDIEHAVERVILRCLEKDPVRRPGSARQVAAALPGGDPLAAAVAAGETPSPELVAASGEEGTLPRWQAWSWLAASAAAFAALMSVVSWWNLASGTTLPHPELQAERARQILRQAGYGEPPSDSAWWMRANLEYLVHYRDLDDGGRALAAAAAGPRAAIFCYRQGPARLVTASGSVSADEPAPVAAGDAYVELGTSGGLIELRVVPSRADGDGAPSGAIDWSPLFTAADLEPGRLKPAGPAWGPLYAFDTRAAWEGVLENEPVRVEAAARHGRPTYFRVTPAWMTRAAARDVVAPAARVFLAWVNASLFLGCVAFLAVLAARNVRLGRGDRRGAGRIAVFMAALLAVGNVLSRHWAVAAGAAGAGTGGLVMPGTAAVGPVQQVVATLGSPLFLAVAFGLVYMGFEPYVRRRWPALLITSTRLLDGRWRDPLVGRSLLVGLVGAIATCLAMFASIAISRLGGWGVVIPGFPAGTLDGVVPFAGYLARTWSIYELVAFIDVGVMLAARFVLRSTPGAWLGLTAMNLVMFAGWGRVFLGPFPILVGMASVALTAGAVLVLWRGGLLGLAVWLAATVLLRDTPWTSELTRWHAGPTWLAGALLAGLALWGFKNVLGRQSAFSAES